MKLHLKLNNENGIYYNIAKPLSYNPFISLLVGGRGIGKTTTCLIYALSNFSNKGEQFVYLRRYTGEIASFRDKKSLDTIVDNVIYKGDGNKGLNIMIGDETIGYAIALSKYLSYKSSDFSKVTTIIFDEMTIKVGSNIRYLVDEVNTFFEMISTIIRLRKNVRIFCIGNNADLFCPLINYFKIPMNKQVYYDSEKRLYFELCSTSKELKDKEKETPLYHLLHNTTYGQYHYDNKVLTNKVGIIGVKPKDSELCFRIVFDNNTINIYRYNEMGLNKCYCEFKKKAIVDKLSYVLMSKGNINYYYLNRLKKECYNQLVYYWYNDYMLFNNNDAITYYENAINLLG